MIRFLFFFILVSSLFAKPSKLDDCFDTYYPHMAEDRMKYAYAAFVFSLATDCGYPAMMVEYAYEDGVGSAYAKGGHTIVIFKRKNQYFAVDNQSMKALYVPFQTAKAAIEFYWVKSLGHPFTTITIIDFQINDVNHPERGLINRSELGSIGK